MVGLFEQRETEQQQQNPEKMHLKISDSQVFFIQVMIWD